MTDHWISIADAALLARRTTRTIYAWIDKGLLKTHLDDDGTTKVSGRQVLAIEPTIKRGRPTGTARPHTR